MRVSLTVLSVFIAFAGSAVAHSADREPAGLFTPLDSSPSPVSAEPDPAPSGLFGDWGGRRTRWHERGIDLGIVYKGEYHRFTAHGETRSGYFDNLDLRLGWDLGKSHGLTGTSFFIYGLGNSGADRGDGTSAQLGDAQGVSNIETGVDAFRLYEAWFQQEFAEGRFSVLAGLHDLNSEFYVTDASALFFNASFGIGREISQTGENGPSIFPVTAPALRLRWQPSPEFYVQTAVFNARAGNPDRPRDTVVRLNREDGTLWLAEAAYLPGGSEPTGKLALGSWAYSNKFDDLNRTETDDQGNVVPAKSALSGAYLLAETKLGPVWTGFLRYGTAHSATVRFGSNLGLGVVAEGFWSARPADRVGLAMTRAENGADYLRAAAALGTPEEKSETVYELNYRFQFDNWALQPDVQHLVHPNTQAAPADTVTSLRVELNF